VLYDVSSPNALITTITLLSSLQFHSAKDPVVTDIAMRITTKSAVFTTIRLLVVEVTDIIIMMGSSSATRMNK
jgi:hypothetical protein